MRSIISAITTRRHFVFVEERACGGQLFSECDTVGVGLAISTQNAEGLQTSSMQY